MSNSFRVSSSISFSSTVYPHISLISKFPTLLNDYVFDNDLYGQCYIDAYNKKGGKNYGISI